MSTSREESPDWLRDFQAPSRSLVTLSSDSEASPNGSPSIPDQVDEEELQLKSSQTINDNENLGELLDQNGAQSSSMKRPKLKSRKKGRKVEVNALEKKKSGNYNKRKGDGNGGNVAKKVKVEDPMVSHELNHSIWTLSSDSELCPDGSPTKENRMHQGELFEHETFELERKEMDQDAVLIKSNEDSPKKGVKISVRKGLQLDDNSSINEKTKGVGMKTEDAEVTVEEAFDKKVESHVSSSRLPLMLSEKVQRSKVLVECEGDSMDLSGDMGAVGRIIVSDTPSGGHELCLDLKGTIYRTTIVPSRTFCVVSFGQSEAKIDAIMNDFIQLKQHSNVYEAETMVEGTLDGFSFDSDNEADKMPKGNSHQTDHPEDGEEQNKHQKTKAEKTSGVTRKRGKTVGGKPQPVKKARKKAQASKKAKSKK